MEVQSDFRELLELLNEKQADFIIVGAHALAFHGVPRYTGDIDIYVKPERENAERVLGALEKFGFDNTGLSIEDFSEEDKIAQLGYPPARIDIMTSISGVSWEEAKDGSVKGAYGNVPARFLGKTEFVRNKKSTGRIKDLADVEALGEL